MEGVGLQNVRRFFYNICTEMNDLNKITGNSDKFCKPLSLPITPKGAVSCYWITPVTTVFCFAYSWIDMHMLIWSWENVC